MANEPIGLRLQKIRDQLGMTQAALAQSAGVDVSWVSKTERLETPRVDKLIKALAVLGYQLKIEPIETSQSVPGLGESSSRTHDPNWATCVEAYLRSPRGAETPPLIAAKLMLTNGKPATDDGLVHLIRQQLEQQEGLLAR